MKKCLIFLLALIVILNGTLIGCSCENGDGEPSSETMGTIDVPEGGKIKVVSKLPAELKLTLEELGIDQYFQLVFAGKVKNISSYSVSFDKISFILDGEEIAYRRTWFDDPSRSDYKPLGPGEELEFYFGKILGVEKTQKAKLLEVKAVNFQIIGGSTTPTKPTPSEPTEPEMTTEEVLIKWFDLMKKEKFSEAEKLLAPDYKKHLDSYGGLKKMWQENPMTEIKILGTQFETKTAIVYVIITFEDDTVWDNDARFRFEKIDNEWKIDEISQ